ncbi:AIR carboxylase family protein [Candidatus Peregrinibacteria bacterium]|nr:AIR carboxylase family protein [Candidatus Peregrinibacteria bacterium]
MLIPIILGSEKDKAFAEKITAHLDAFDIPYKIHVASAHKVPELVLSLVENYNKSSEAVCYITIAGRSNGLSGVVAANAVHPVIACPPYKDHDDMMVNINSTLMMPSDTPVMTVIDPQNAAMAALRILGLTSSELNKKVVQRIGEVKRGFLS